MDRLRLTTVERRGFRYGGPLEVSACGRWLIAWSYHGVRVFDAAQPGAPVWASGERVLALRVVEGGLVYATSAPNRLIARRFGAWDEAREAALEAAPRALAAAGPQAFVVTADGALRRFVFDADALVEGGVLAGEPTEAVVLALSGDGLRLALSRGELKARSAVVEVLDAEGLAVTHAMKGLRAACKCLVFSPDNQAIAAATAASAVVWAGPKAKAQSVFKAARKIEALWWADAAHLLVTDEQEAAVCVEVASGQERWRHAHYGPATLRGGRFLHARYGELWLRDVQTGLALREIEAPGHPRELALHADGEVAFMYTTHGALIRTWRLDRAHVEPSGELGGDMITCAAADEALAWLALGTDSGAVLVHALPVGGGPRVIGELRGKYGMGSCKALMIDAARDRVWGASEASVVGWRLSTGEQLASWGVADARGQVLYAPPQDDVLLVATDDYYGKQALRVFALGEEAPRHTLTPAQRIDALVSAPGGVLCHGYATAQRLDLASWQLDAPVSAALPWPPVEQLVCEAKRVGVARWLDGARWATLHDDGALRVWDAACTLQSTHPTGLRQPAAIFVVSDRLIVACGEDGEVVLCHLDSTVQCP